MPIDVSAARERFSQIPPMVRLAWGTAFIVAIEAIVGPRNYGFSAHCFYYFAAGIALLALYGLRAISREQSTRLTKLPGQIMAGSVINLMLVPMLFHGEWPVALLAALVVVASLYKTNDYEPRHSVATS